MASNSPSFAQRVQTIVSENKRVILCTAAIVLAVGGIVVYTSTSRRPRGADPEKGERRSKDRKKTGNSHKKTRGPKADDGPILEERTPSAEDEEPRLIPSQIQAMSAEKRSQTAASLKIRGNEAYQQRKYDVAINCYTDAIAVSPKEDAIYYSNRAACYMNITPPNYTLALQDCDSSLRIDSHYVKALNRRASALENLERYEEALRDFLAASILDKFANESTVQSVERALKKLATQRAIEVSTQRQPRLPSITFVSSYFAAFRPRPTLKFPEFPSTGELTLKLALEALAASDYTHALSFVNESLEQGMSWNLGMAEALNLRGTFRFLIGDVDGAKADFLKSIELVPSFTQSLVKVASVYMDHDDPAQAFTCFEKAIEQNPNDPDIYYHRGQVRFLMKDFTSAASDYANSCQLDDRFVFSHVQLAVAQYKQGDISKSKATFKKTMEAFPERSEPQNYYGELLLDQQLFEDAIEKFDRAIQMERSKSSGLAPNVLPLVNKGLALFQWKQDVVAAEECCNEALRLDPECEVAVATLAQLSLHQNLPQRAMELFARQAELARSEPELLNALSFQYASSAQLEFLKNYPDMAPQLAHIARTLVS